MKIIVKLDRETIRALSEFTGQPKRSLAVQTALADYIRRMKPSKIIRMAMSGMTDYGLTNDQLESRSFYRIQSS